MSLTSHLKTPRSPVRQFLYAHFPNARAIVADCRSKLASATTLRPAAPVAWGTVGTALDYRARYYFGVTPPKEFVAWDGALLCTGSPVLTAVGEQPGARMLDPALAEEFFAELSQVVAEMNPVARRLDGPQEARLTRYCYVLALFEEVFRAGPQINSPLFAPPKRAVDELLAIPSTHAIEDLCTLSWGAYTQFEGLLSQSAILNPTFDGSLDVGGADADLILDGCLIDIKTTVKPQVDQIWLYQLLGYTLLDYTNRYRISEVAIYMARQQTTFRWPLDHFMATMTGGDGLPLGEVRARFQRVAST